jgi:hypothetical protein
VIPVQHSLTGLAAMQGGEHTITTADPFSTTSQTAIEAIKIRAAAARKP